MKTITTLLALVIGFSSFANASDISPEIRRSASMQSLKMMISLTAESTSQLQQDVTKTVRRYNELGFFQLGAKNTLIRENCAEVEATLSASALMLAATLELAQEDLKYIPEFNNDRTLQEFTKIVTYFGETKKAQDTCRNPAQSLQHLTNAAQLVNEVNAYLEQNVPSLIFKNAK